MLVLARRLNEEIYVGDDVVITVVDIGRGRVRLGIKAPSHVRIDRAEVRDERRVPEVTPEAAREPAE